MKKFLLLALVVVTTGFAAETLRPLPVTPFTVIARVVSHEHFIADRAFIGNYLDAAYGWRDCVVAEIVHPQALAGREIAMPYEQRLEPDDPLTHPGTLFRWESTQNLGFLRNSLDRVRRTAMPFPARGVIALDADGRVAAAYPSYLNAFSKR